MRFRVLVFTGLAGVLAAVAVASGAPAPPSVHAVATPTGTSTSTTTTSATSPQALFSPPLLADAKVTKSIKSMLRNKTGFIDPHPVIADLNDDGKADALVSVTTGGAGGAFALYVLSTYGSKSGALKVIFRTQQLYGAAVTVLGDSFTVTTPHWSAGDDLCCPKKIVKRSYEWRSEKKAFIRTESSTFPGPTTTTPVTTTTPTTTTG